MEECLPLEVLSRIVSLLPWKSWLAFRAVCVRFFHASDRDQTWKDWLQRMFCWTLELQNTQGDSPIYYKEAFLALARRRFQIVDDIHNIFVILDDSPLVQRCGGSGIVFVVTLDFTCRRSHASSNFFEVRKAPASAPWGTFDSMVLQWGSLFAAFGFNNHGVSVYSGRLGPHWTFGSLYSSWNEVTGSFLLHQAQDFAPKLNDNAWGEAFSAFHCRKVEHLPWHVGCSWTFVILFDDLAVSDSDVERETQSKKAKCYSFFDSRLPAEYKVVVTVDSCNTRGGLSGRAQGSIANTSSDWKMRGIIDKGSGMLSLILFAVLNDNNSFSLMMIGSLNHNTVIDTRAVLVASDGLMMCCRCVSEKTETKSH